QSFVLAWRTLPERADDGVFPRSLRGCNRRPSGRRAAECGQQFPPSHGDCHTPLPCEVRKRNDTTPRACSLQVQGGRMLVASTSVFGFSLHSPRRQLFANAAIVASCVGS